MNPTVKICINYKHTALDPGSRQDRQRYCSGLDPTLTLDLDLDFQCLASYGRDPTYEGNQGQRSAGSKAAVETVGRTRPIALPFPLKSRSQIRCAWLRCACCARDGDSMYFNGGIHTYAALCVAAPVKYEAFYQRSAAARRVCVNGP